MKNIHATYKFGVHCKHKKLLYKNVKCGTFVLWPLLQGQTTSNIQSFIFKIMFRILLPLFVLATFRK